MHQPRPYGLHAIGLPLTECDEAFVASVAKRITNLKNISKVDSIKMVYDLPDGGYVIVQDMGGNFRVIAHKPRYEKDVIFDGLASGYIPMLYSGVITKAVVYPDEPVGIKLTEQARLRLINYDQAEKKPNKNIALQRFRIDYSDMFFEFKPKLESAILKTQYDKLRPTWYSGAMAEVMQIIGGYGRQDFDVIPDEDWERSRLVLPVTVTKDIENELDNIRLPAYTGIPNRRGQFQYDYKFNNTNAVSFDKENKPWLVRINQSGVWVMPLPTVPATTTLAFREYMEKVEDAEILAILNKFGGMPSGETFPPQGKSFEAWRRAGVIIKVCDTSDFYSHITYSSALGWSLNLKGTEGYNTCYDYYDDEGLGYGLTYKLTLQLQPSESHWGESVDDITKIMLPERAQKVQQYLNGLIPALGTGTATANAIFYKLRRVGPYVIHDRALIHEGANDKDYWDNLDLEPIANHTGNVSEVYRGYLYHPLKSLYQPQIKFPEPLAGGCLSHDFLPLDNGRYKDKYPNSDTIMMAYYIGNTLNVVKYFVDWGTFARSTTSNYEKYMRAGSWEQTSYSGETGVQGYFYTTDIDERELVSPTTINTKIVGVDKGYNSTPNFAYDGPFHMCGDLWRDRYFTHKTNSVTDVGKAITIGICIPYLCRNAVIYANKDEVNSRTTSESLRLYSVRDPTSYRYWTYDAIFAWQVMTITKPKGVPDPRGEAVGNPVWVEEVIYEPVPGSDFADNGPWIPGLPYNYTFYIHPNNNEWIQAYAGPVPPVDNYRIDSTPTRVVKGKLSLSLMDAPVVISLKEPKPTYFIGSPDEIGNIFYRDACAIVFGGSTYANVSEPSANADRAFWGNTNLPDHKSAHHFIGVINE